LHKIAMEELKKPEIVEEYKRNWKRLLLLN
jgi:hypothetical protein